LPFTSPPLDGAAVATSRGFGSAGGNSDACAANLLAVREAATRHTFLCLSHSSWRVRVCVSVPPRPRA